MPPQSSRPHHGHIHSHQERAHRHGPTNYNRAFVLGLALNSGFVLTEVVFGLMAHSVALLADAGHNLSDILGLLLAWVASLLARRRPSARYTYGWRKSSILAAFLNAIFLLVATGGIMWESVQRLLSPGAVEGTIVIMVATIGIAINTGTALMFVSGRQRDLNLRVAFQHMAADALVSLGVVLAGVAIVFTRWLWLDPALSLFISALIIVSTWGLLKDSFHLVIDGVPHNIDEWAVRTYLSERTGVAQVHDLHIWGMGTTETALTAHLVMPTGHPGDGFIAQSCRELREHFGIHHVTLQIETGDAEYPCDLDPSCH